MRDFRLLAPCVLSIAVAALQTPNMVHAQEAANVPVGLVVTGTVAGTYDSRLVAGLSGIPTTAESTGGGYPSAGGGLTFRRTRPTRDWSLQAQTGAQYVHQIDEPLVHSHRVSVAALWRRSARTTIDATATSSFASFYNLAGLVDGLTALSGATPDQLAPVASPQVRVVAQNNWWQGGRVGITRRLGPRTQIGGGLGVAASSLSAAATGVTFQRLVTVTPRALVQRQITPRTTLGAGYSLEQNIIGTSTFRNQQVQGDVEYRGRALLIRAFAGATLTYAGSVGQQQGVGGLRLTRPIARGWSGAAGYRRGVQFSTVFAQFLNSDVADGSLSRVFGRRVELELLGNYSRGTFIGFNGLRIDSRSFGGQMTWVLTRSVGAVANYNYFVYSLADSIALSSGLPPEATRNVISVGLAWQTFGRP